MPSLVSSDRRCHQVPEGERGDVEGLHACQLTAPRAPAVDHFHFDAQLSRVDAYKRRTSQTPASSETRPIRLLRKSRPILSCSS
jgi:hypothetical protein